MARTGADRYLMTMPMFHVGGTGVVNCMTFRAGSLAVVPSFDTESFWSLVRRTEATVVFLLGAIASFPVETPAGATPTRPWTASCFCIPAKGPCGQFDWKTTFLPSRATRIGPSVNASSGRTFLILLLLAVMGRSMDACGREASGHGDEPTRERASTRRLV